MEGLSAPVCLAWRSNPTATLQGGLSPVQSRRSQSQKVNLIPPGHRAGKALVQGWSPQSTLEAAALSDSTVSSLCPLKVESPASCQLQQRAELCWRSRLVHNPIGTLTLFLLK